MNIGYLQFAPVFGDLNATLNKIKSFENQINNIDLLVLPELSNSGYNFKNRSDAFAASETVQESKMIEYFAALCRKQNMYVVAGMNEKSGELLYNTSVLIGPRGVLGKYRKLHLFWNEKYIFEPGNLALTIYDTGDFKIGMLICFDWIVPEVWRILAMKGAEIICHPSNLVLPGKAQRAVPVHALTNRIYTVTANRVGTEDNLTFTGMSTIASPSGDILLQSGREEEGVFKTTVDINQARNKMVTPANHVFNDRRSDVYKVSYHMYEHF